MHNVVFYCDSESFGGHEKMAVAAHAAIRRHCDEIQISWLVNACNHRLVEALEQARFHYTTLVDAPSFSPRRNPLRALFKISRTAATLWRLSPDLVMVVQGNIARSYDGILSSLLSGLRCCSYLPAAFRISSVRNYKFPALADFAWSLLYRTTRRYITIDEEQAGNLRLHNPKASILVVENCIPRSVSIEISADGKASLKIPPGKKVLAVIGRIDFPSKCQDWIFRELSCDPFLSDKFVLFVGDGQDFDKLQAMLVPEVCDRFGLISWRNDLRDIYAATDVLLIPSRVEGVPLVMLEALDYGIPVVGADHNGMRSWLPAEWRFDWGDTAGLKRAIGFALSARSCEVKASFAERLNSIHDEVRFATQFREALIHFGQH